jgi:hypothetical protein
VLASWPAFSFGGRFEWVTLRRNEALGLVNQVVTLINRLMIAIRASRSQSIGREIRLVMEKKLLQGLVVNCGMTEGQ